MSLLAIDPGKTHFGYAVFSQNKLIGCGTQKHSSNEGLALIAVDLAHGLQSTYYGCIVVMEKPENYLRNNKSKSLEGLVALCNAVHSAVGVHRFYTPKQWKGQVPKDVHHERLARVLSASELVLWGAVDHNAKDAIGIGLFHLGRTKRGGIV